MLKFNIFIFPSTSIQVLKHFYYHQKNSQTILSMNSGMTFIQYKCFSVVKDRKSKEILGSI